MSKQLEIRAPAEQTEGTRSQLLRWLKRPGEPVTENEPLIEIETDKVTVEVASPGTGVLSEILRREQEEITPGELLGRIDAGAAAAPAAAPAPQPAAGGAALRRAAPASSAAGSAAASPATGSGASPLSPAVRRLLTERGLDAASVRGSGANGRITVEDVLAAAPTVPERRRERPAAPAAAESAETAAIEGPSRRVPHSSVRRRIAEHMVQSLRSAPHVTTVFEADLSAVLADRARRREEFERHGVPLTLTAYFVQAAVAAIRAVPEANSRWTDAALEVYESIHIGVATAVEGVGLLVPVLKDAGRRDLPDTARALDELVGKARAGRLTPADVRGGTFTISNHGVSGSLLAAPIIINQPQAAILGIGKLENRPVAVGEGTAQRITVQPRCYVTLTLDHRVMDGHQANRFLQVFVGKLTQWPG